MSLRPTWKHLSKILPKKDAVAQQTAQCVKAATPDGSQSHTVEGESLGKVVLWPP